MLTILVQRLWEAKELQEGPTGARRQGRALNLVSGKHKREPWPQGPPH